MITYTVIIEQLDEKRCTVHFNTVRENETQAELEDATIVAEKLRQASDEITERYATIGAVSVLDGAVNIVPELKDAIRKKSQGNERN